MISSLAVYNIDLRNVQLADLRVLVVLDRQISESCTILDTVDRFTSSFSRKS